MSTRPLKTAPRGILGREGLLDGEELIMGPYSLYDGSFILEFYSPDSAQRDDATVLMRTSYVGGNPLLKMGKTHPQAPPLHLHFEQKETFQVIRGSIGTTRTWELTDRIYRPEDGRQVIDCWEPHRFWPDPDNTEEDSVFLVWAHPNEGVDGPMDHIFFLNILAYVSDLYETKQNPSALQLCLIQHPTNTSLIMFPTWNFLGPLRWGVPWYLQSIVARIAKFSGYQELMPEYTTPEQMAEFRRSKLL